jgi:TonB family protein
LSIEVCMQYDIQEQLRSIKQTRERLVALHQFLRDKLFRYAKEMGIADKREDLNSLKIMDSLSSEPFPPAIKIEITVILAQLKQTHAGLSQLDAEIGQLVAKWQEFKKAATEPAAIPPPNQLAKGYGAIELKQFARRYLSWGLSVAAVFHLILLGLYWTTQSLLPEPEKQKTVRLKYLELSTPPSTNMEPPASSPPPAGQSNLFGGLTAQNLGVLGMIVPVDDATYKANTRLLLDDRSLKDLDRLMTQSQVSRGNGNGNSYEGGSRNGSGSGGGRGQGGGNGLDLDNVEVTGGIDDLISDLKGVQTVKLEKKGQVNIETPGQMRGSQAAMVRRSSETVMAVINSQQGRIMYTYTKYLRTEPNLHGKVSIDITIEADGAVSKANLVESTMNNADFDRDVVNILRRLRFEPIPEGSLTVNLPFVFSRAE